MFSAADVRVLFALAVAQLMKGNASEAIELSTRCLSIGANNAQIHLLRGYAFSLLPRWQQAIADYTKSLVLEPRNLLCLLAKAYALFQSSKYQSAVYDYSSVLELDPGNLIALANRGAINELCLNGIPSGMDDLNLAESLDSSGFRVALLKALAYRRRNFIADSLEQFNHVLQRYRTSDALNADDISIAHNCMGIMLAKQSSDSGDAKEKARILNLRHALVHFQKAAARPKMCSVAMQNAGQILTQLGRPSEALAAFEQSANTGSDDPLVANNFAVILQRCGNTVQALRWMRVALAADADYSIANYNLGAILTMMGSWRDAISALDRSLKLFQSGKIYNNRGICYQSLGQLDEADADYTRAIGIAPDCLPPRWNRMLNNAARMNFRLALLDIVILRNMLDDEAVNQKVILDKISSYCHSWQYAFRVLTSQILVSLQNLPPFCLVDRHPRSTGIVTDSTLCEPRKFGIHSSTEHRILIESVSKLGDTSLNNLIFEICQNQAQHKIDRVLLLLMQAIYSVNDGVLRAKFIAWRCVLLLQKGNLEAVEAEIAPLLSSKAVLSTPYSGLVNLAGLIQKKRGDVEKALALFALAQKTDPTNVFPLMNSAECHQQAEHYYEAFHLAAKIIVILLQSSTHTKRNETMG